MKLMNFRWTKVIVGVIAFMILAALVWAFLAPTGPFALAQAKARYWALTGNAGTSPGANFLGTSDNRALELRVKGARALRLEPNATSPNVIGGHSGNEVTAEVFGATIGGGGAEGLTNRVAANYGTVGGGYNNTASGTEAAAVGGGFKNTASGMGATVGGGQYNTASGKGATVGGGTTNWASGVDATVGGGGGNTASDRAATVAGGQNNAAIGPGATVAGGAHNTAQGLCSFAAGWHAKAEHPGAFVWADSQEIDFPSTATNQFSARSRGGARFVSAVDGKGKPTAGVELAAGASSWSSLSDRELKENFAPVDGQEVLARLTELPITTWNYKAQDPTIRHMGPVAQDFYAAFGLGEDERHISTVDADGVALAAIQGLYQLSQEQNARISRLETENATLREELEELKALVAKLAEGQ